MNIVNRQTPIQIDQTPSEYQEGRKKPRRIVSIQNVTSQVEDEYFPNFSEKIRSDDHR